MSRRTLLAATTAAGVGLTTAPAAPATGSGGSGRLHTGFERLAADGYALLDGERVGVVTNPTGVTHGGTSRSSEAESGGVRHIVDVMHADDRVDLVAVFGPEHGFRGTAQAGGSQGRYDDPATGLPVDGTYHWIDKLTGSARVRTMIDAGADTDEVVAGWQDELAAFRTARGEYLLYPAV
jgi:uncharacterized protein YbbC (DUF1343 family)